MRALTNTLCVCVCMWSHAHLGVCMKVQCKNEGSDLHRNICEFMQLTNAMDSKGDQAKMGNRDCCFFSFLSQTSVVCGPKLLQHVTTIVHMSECEFSGCISFTVLCANCCEEDRVVLCAIFLQNSFKLGQHVTEVSQFHKMWSTVLLLATECTKRQASNFWMNSYLLVRSDQCNSWLETIDVSNVHVKQFANTFLLFIS